MADHQDPSFIPPEDSSLENYTGSELPFKPLYVILAVVLITCVVFAVGLLPLKDVFNRVADARSASELAPSAERPSGPRLQQSPEGDWKVWERMMSEQLSGYGWQDRANGVARIPVDAAIGHALEEGLIASQPDAPISSASLRAASSEADSHATGDHRTTTDDHSEGGDSH